jgi:hypothetical protein
MDSYLHRREKRMEQPLDFTPDSPLKLHGTINLVFIGMVIAAILMSAYWKPGIAFRIHTVEVELQNIVRDGVFVLATL